MDRLSQGPHRDTHTHVFTLIFTPTGNVDFLTSRTLCAGFLDWVPKKMQRVGCMELLNTVQRRVQPKLHVFGHIHEGIDMYLNNTVLTTEAYTAYGYIFSD